MTPFFRARLRTASSGYAVTRIVGIATTGIDEVSVELDPAHSRHLDVSDQACGRTEKRRCQKIGREGKVFDRVTQRGREFSHGFSKELIILYNRYYCTFRHHGFNFARPPPYDAQQMSRLMPNVIRIRLATTQCLRP